MKKIKGLIIPLVIIIVWIIVDKLHLFNSYIIPSPKIVLTSAYELLMSGELPKNLAVGTRRRIP